MKIRIKFRKWGVMKFIGHLDMMRYFQKAVRRAKIDIRYSEGYSPHQIMSFAAPLGVGITSDGEYFDIEVNESMTSKEAVAALNETMVDGVEVTSYVKLPDKAKTAMSIVAAADYRLSYKEGYESPFSTEEWKRIVKERFLDSPQFTIIKKTKKSEREVDLKPLVYAFPLKRSRDARHFSCRFLRAVWIISNRNWYFHRFISFADWNTANPQSRSTGSKFMRGMNRGSWLGFPAWERKLFK